MKTALSSLHLGIKQLEVSTQLSDLNFKVSMRVLRSTKKAETAAKAAEVRISAKVIRKELRAQVVNQPTNKTKKKWLEWTKVSN